MTTPIQRRIEYLVTNGRGYHDAQGRYSRMDRHNLEMEALTNGIFLQEINPSFGPLLNEVPIYNTRSEKYELLDMDLDDLDWADMELELEEIDYD